MANPPRIWLHYRPVRIGWLVDTGNLQHVAAAASWTTCLWGGRFNPIIPAGNPDLAKKLVEAFRVDVLIPVAPSDETGAIIKAHRHLDLLLSSGNPFRDNHCKFVDMRHAVRRAATTTANRGIGDPSKFVRPVWSADDPMSILFTLIFGQYPSADQIGLNYISNIRSQIDMPDWPITSDGNIPADLVQQITPLDFTGFDLSARQPHWLGVGLVVGSAADFDDLIMFWNLKAAGASLCFYDSAHINRWRPFIDSFVSTMRNRLTNTHLRFNIWGRNLDPPWDPASLGLDLAGVPLAACRASDAQWNGRNVKPVRPHFSSLHRDVVASYVEGNGSATASFALLDRPFDDGDIRVLDQQYVVTVEANEYGSTTDELTFRTPFVPRLNEFYGRNFFFIHDKARSEPGSLGDGAVGIVTNVGTQRLTVQPFRVQDWLGSFFELVNIKATRSQPGLRAASLIHQMGGLRATHALKVRGARELIRKYGPDHSFTRSEAEKCIGNFDEQTQRMRFGDFENLYIQARPRGGRLTPGEVLQYMTSKGIFRVGLEFRCPICELPSWLPLDEVRTVSTCAYCGHQFDVTPQLKDRDWRYRRSGLFGREDNQLGAIPVTLALQQIETSLHQSLLMYSTAQSFTSTTAAIETCEADFIAVIAGAGIEESPVQLVLGEAKTQLPFDHNDIRKLRKLADTVPHDLAQSFIMFAKTEAFTPDEIALAKTLNTPYRQRVILWSIDELEPYDVYDRSKDRLGPSEYATTLADMARVTAKIWFTED